MICILLTCIYLSEACCIAVVILSIVWKVLFLNLAESKYSVCDGLFCLYLAQFAPPSHDLVLDGVLFCYAILDWDVFANFIGAWSLQICSNHFLPDPRISHPDICVYYDYIGSGILSWTCALWQLLERTGCLHGNVVLRVWYFFFLWLWILVGAMIL